MSGSPEFSRRFAVAKLPAEGMEFRVAATEAERRALCRRFSLAGLEHLAAVGRITPEPGGIYRLEGRLQAEVTQTCVVTLAPVAASIDAAILRRFGSGVEDEWTDVADSSVEVVLAADGEAFVEPMVEDAIDAGEVVAEQLALELDPFPRAVGVEFRGYPDAPENDHRDAENDREAGSPFKALKALKNKLPDGS
ncbi:MAG: DUF177 domain-containing protein [Rhodospirillales bacterium]|nr:DUF177 domain-containing protein [Rhodospirillales bacterium]